MPTPRSGYSTQKIDTHKRQKAIQLLEKITKNMFRMFRDEETVRQTIVERFNTLKKQLDALGEIALTGKYHREMKNYVVHLSHLLDTNIDIDTIRAQQMSKLNRIQKIKNQSGYKRKKRGF